jgi:hypothetical protein
MLSKCIFYNKILFVNKYSFFVNVLSKNIISFRVKLLRKIVNINFMKQKFLLMLSLTAVLFAKQELNAQTITANTQGTHNGYFYSFWTENPNNGASMTLGAGGNYSTTWNNTLNFTAGKGWAVGTRDRVVCYEGTYNGGSNGFLALYGWTKNPLIEYYVCEKHGQWTPPGNTGDVVYKGEYTSDGGTYKMYTGQRVNKPSIIGTATFTQFWSVRTEQRSAGTITFANHVNAWETTGNLQLGTTWDYQIMESEGYNSSGNSNITIIACNTCATAAPTVTATVNYEVGDQATQLTATGTTLKWYTAASGGTASTTAPTPNTATAGSTIYYVSSTANGCESTRSAITVNVSNTYKIYKVTAPITIDGTLENVWKNGTSVPMNATKLLSGAVTNNADLSGFGKMLWDNTYLYLMATITDDTKQNDSQNSYDDDQVEFYLDLNNAKAATYDSDDYQLSFGWNDGTVVGSIPTGASKTNITYSAVATTNGYIIEARIPWSTLSFTAAANKLIGIDFMINDDDNNGTRDGKLSWNSATDQAYQNASLFSTGKLVSQELITGTEDNEELTTSFSVYPNPVEDVLTLSQVSEFELYTITGVLIEKGVSDSVDFSSLSKGTYILKTKNQVIRVLK